MKKFTIIASLLAPIALQAMDTPPGVNVDGDGNPLPKSGAPTLAPNPQSQDPMLPNPSPDLTNPTTAKNYLDFGIEAAKKQDYKAAFSFFTQACDNGDPAGCFALGTMFVNGIGIQKDLQKAERYYEVGCSGGDPTACSALASIYDKKRNASFDDKQKAIELYMTGCSGGDLVACNNLAYSYAQGDGVKKDYFKALQYYRYSCDGGNDIGCYNLGLLSNTNNIYGYDRANLTPADLNYIACNAGDIKGCANLGWIYANGLAGAPVSYFYAGQYFKKACDASDIPSCNNLAVLYQRGLGVTQDTKKALDLFAFTCNAGNQAGCNNYKIFKDQLSSRRSYDSGELFFPNDPKLGKRPFLGRDPRVNRAQANRR
ncbi:MAG: SEL1-like repeat protein [Helicobacter sp.]|nr:SEL1-like repeat protein [Helicobacter sp.]